MPEKSSLVTIERVVAFVLGPIVVAGSGALSAWLSTKLNVHLSGAELTGAFATGGLAAAGLVWHWLTGRQLDMKLKQNTLIEQLQFGIAPPRSAAPLQISRADIQDAVDKAFADFVQRAAGMSGQGPPVDAAVHGSDGEAAVMGAASTK